jgi:hypothetical protein
LSQFDSWDLFAYIKKEVGIYGVDDYESKAQRMKTIAYNAIVLGELEFAYDLKNLICELGCTEEELDEIMGG